MYDAGIPAGATLAWGCTAYIQPDGTLHIPPELRQFRDASDGVARLDFWREFHRTALRQWQDEALRRIDNHRMNPDDAGEHILHTEPDGFTVKAKRTGNRIEVCAYRSQPTRPHRYL